jgi:hypothetical protein
MPIPKDDLFPSRLVGSDRDWSRLTGNSDVTRLGKVCRRHGSYRLFAPPVANAISAQTNRVPDAKALRETCTNHRSPQGLRLFRNFAWSLVA